MRTVYALVPQPFQVALADLLPFDDEPELFELLDADPMPNSWLISRINVPREIRRQGYGSKLLELICTDADAEHATLFLEVSAAGGTPMTVLYGWYGRYDFHKYSTENRMLVRSPKCRRV